MIAKIEDIPGYYITSEGTVLNSSGLKMKPSLAQNGYYRIEIKVEGKKVKHRIHRLVAQHFVPNPDNKPQVNHKDGDKTNNRFTNLEWVTNQENMLHAVKHNLTHYDSFKQKGKLYGALPFRPVRQLDLDGNEISRFNTVKEAKRITGIQISGALSGRYKTAGGYKWEYL